MTRPRGPAAAVLALHWQVNVIKPEGFFARLLAEPVARSGVVARAAEFHAAARSAGAGLIFTRFTVPGNEGSLVRNTAFMRAVGDAQEMFRPEAPGAQLIPEMAALAGDAHVADNQKLSGLASSDVVRWLLDRSISTVFITGVATNLTVEQTARHGTDLGLTVYVVRDCAAAADEAVHAASLANLELTTAGCLTAEEALEKIRSLGWPAPSVPKPSGSGFGLSASAPDAGGSAAPGSAGPGPGSAGPGPGSASPAGGPGPGSDLARFGRPIRTGRGRVPWWPA